jgi:hypothetical protein
MFLDGDGRRWASEVSCVLNRALLARADEGLWFSPSQACVVRGLSILGWTKVTGTCKACAAKPVPVTLYSMQP